MSGFRDTDEFEKTWNCRFTGSKKDKNVVNLTPSDKSFLIGYYLSSREFKDKADKVHMIHKMHVVEMGDPAHSSAPITNPKGEIREFFGTKVLNKKLGEKITAGQFIKVLWLGKNTAPKNGGEPYEDWKVLVDDSKAPFLGGESPAGEAKKADAPKGDKAKTEAKTEAKVETEEEEDELPF